MNCVYLFGIAWQSLLWALLLCEIFKVRSPCTFLIECYSRHCSFYLWMFHHQTSGLWRQHCLKTNVLKCYSIQSYGLKVLAVDKKQFRQITLKCVLRWSYFPKCQIYGSRSKCCDVVFIWAFAWYHYSRVHSLLWVMDLNKNRCTRNSVLNSLFSRLTSLHPWACALS